MIDRLGLGGCHQESTFAHRSQTLVFGTEFAPFRLQPMHTQVGCIQVTLKCLAFRCIEFQLFLDFSQTLGR